MAVSRKKRIFQIFLLVGTVISLFYVPWIVVWIWIQPLPDTVQEQVDDTIGYGFDGAIVYVDRAGEAPAFYAAGLKNRSGNIPADPHALFKIASISKLYVAVAIAKLVHDGRLSLDQTLVELFPELNGRIVYADRITLRMMVQHRSGIPNFTDQPEFWKNHPGGAEEILELVLDLPADFEPDQDYAYSNTNYLLLRQLIEKTLGYDHFQYIREEILIPLRLNRTYGSLREVPIDDVMSGYHVGYDADLKTDDVGMLATAQDVGDFLRALNDGSVFTEGEQEIYSSIYVYDHTGLVPGYQSIAKYHRDMDAVVVQFTNTTDFDGYNWNLSEIAYSRIVKILRK